MLLAVSVTFTVAATALSSTSPSKTTPINTKTYDARAFTAEDYARLPNQFLDKTGDRFRKVIKNDMQGLAVVATGPDVTDVWTPEYRLHGKFFSFWPNGKLKATALYEYGVMKTSSSFDVNGKRITPGTLKKGKGAGKTVKNGLYPAYFKNGDIETREYYLDGELHGVQETFHKGGIKRSNTSYVNGRKHGLYESFHKNRKPFELGNYISKKTAKGWRTYQEGTWAEFHKSGHLYKHYFYACFTDAGVETCGKQQGMQSHYNDKSRMKSSEWTMLNGEMNGKETGWTTSFPKGKMLRYISLTKYWNYGEQAGITRWHKATGNVPGKLAPKLVIEQIELEFIPAYGGVKLDSPPKTGPCEKSPAKTDWVNLRLKCFADKGVMKSITLFSPDMEIRLCGAASGSKECTGTLGAQRWIEAFGEYGDWRRHGSYFDLWADGTVKEEGKYLRGDKEGTWRKYMAGGKTLQYEYEYKADVIVTEWFFLYKNGTKYGIKTLYDKGGKKIGCEGYVNGKKIGPC